MSRDDLFELVEDDERLVAVHEALLAAVTPTELPHSLAHEKG